MSDPSFGTTIRRDPGQPWDLVARIEAEVATRIEDAVDNACLEAMVAARRARSLPPPASASSRDREEFHEGVRALLERLRAELLPVLDAGGQVKAADAAARAGDDPLRRLVAVHVVLARALPDYWQRFDAARVRYRDDVVRAARTSGGQWRDWLRRLLGR